MGPVCNRRRSCCAAIADTCNIPYRYSGGVALEVSPAVTVQAVLYAVA